MKIEGNKYIFENDGRSLNLPWRQPQLLTKDFTDTIEEEWNV